MSGEELGAPTSLPRVAMVSTHGYVAAQPPLGAADTGGQVVYVLELSKKLAQLGYEVDIWTRRFEEQPEFERVAEQVRIIRVPCGGRAFIAKEYLHEKLPEWGENALRLMRKHELAYRFIDSHYWDGGLAGQHLAEVLGIPHLHTPHSLGAWKKRQMESDYPGDAEKFEAQYNFAQRIHHERLLYESANLVIATTPPQLELLAEDYEVPPGKCRMIPPGYDDNRFFPVGESTERALRQKLGFGGQVVMAIGRLARNKGYDLLIEAFALVARRNPTVALYLAVGGQRLNEVEEATLAELKAQIDRLELTGRVHFGSFIADEDLADTFRAADVFVLSSRYEPFGMTAIEAMACGTPTVVTIHGGLFRALTFGRHALYADPFDREDLGMMIHKILRHPRLRARLARMGAHKARSLFTWTGVAQQLVALVENRATESFSVGDTEWDEPWNDAD
jgi:mannosylfructose-phosphate synthase